MSWSINGTDVPEGVDQDMLVHADADRPDAAPPRAGAEPPAGMVRLRASVAGNQLRIINQPEDGNYTLAIQVTAQEFNDDSSKTSRSTSVDVNGLEQVVPGLRDARASCFKNYLNRYREEPAGVGAVARALAAQLHRPGDPIWDPDPERVSLGDMVLAADPTTLQLQGWAAELQQAAQRPQDRVDGHSLEVDLTRDQLQDHRTDVGGLEQRLKDTRPDRLKDLLHDELQKHGMRRPF